jgi:hypothetical protein
MAAPPQFVGQMLGHYRNKLVLVAWVSFTALAMSS